MSNFPPAPPNPLQYYTPQHHPSRRPISVSIIAWLATIFGGLGVLSGFCTVIQRQFLTAFQSNDPFSKILYSPGPIGTYMIVSQIVGWFVSILIMTSGIGCLQLKPWARQLMIGVMIFQLVAQLVSIVLSETLLMPAFALVARQNPNDPVVQRAYALVRSGHLFGFIFGFTIPLVVLYFFTRPRAKAAFAEPLPLPPA